MPPNRISDETDPADWFYSASDRLKAADLIWNSEGLTHSGMELLQEASERYLKGYLIAKGWRLTRTHDLRRLIQDAISFDSGFQRFETVARELTEDFFAQHYPGGDWTGVGRNYESIRRAVGEMIEHIKVALPQFFPSQQNP